MTAGQYRRLRRWDVRTRAAYDAGVMDGMDLRFCGYPRPADPDEGYNAPFDLRFVVGFRARREQEIVNHNLARERGKVDGYDVADAQMREAEAEDALLTEVEEGFAQIESYLREKAA